MRCVRLSWRINHDFTLRRSAWPKKKGEGGVGKDREKEEMIGEREFSERRRAGQRGD